MGSLLSALAFRYVTLAGAVVVLGAMGRGLLKAAKHASAGDLEQAGEDALAAAVAPAVMAYDAAAALANDLAETARDLATSAPKWPETLPR